MSTESLLIIAIGAFIIYAELRWIATQRAALRKLTEAEITFHEATEELRAMKSEFGAELEKISNARRLLQSGVTQTEAMMRDLRRRGFELQEWVTNFRADNL